MHRHCRNALPFTLPHPVQSKPVAAPLHWQPAPALPALQQAQQEQALQGPPLQVPPPWPWQLTLLPLLHQVLVPPRAAHAHPAALLALSLLLTQPTLPKLLLQPTLVLVLAQQTWLLPRARPASLLVPYLPRRALCLLHTLAVLALRQPQQTLRSAHEALLLLLLLLLARQPSPRLLRRLPALQPPSLKGWGRVQAALQPGWVPQAAGLRQLHQLVPLPQPLQEPQPSLRAWLLPHCPCAPACLPHPCETQLQHSAAGRCRCAAAWWHCARCRRACAAAPPPSQTLPPLPPRCHSSRLRPLAAAGRPAAGQAQPAQTAGLREEGGSEGESREQQSARPASYQISRLCSECGMEAAGDGTPGTQRQPVPCP